MNANLAVLPGDGIGPEVTAEAVRALGLVGEIYGHDFSFEEGLIGGCALDRHGHPLPPETLELCRRSAAVMLGAVGGPAWSDPAAARRPEDGLLALRQSFHLFANLRPVRAWPGLSGKTPLRAELLEGVDILFVRELTGGLYFGERRDDGWSAFDTMTYSVDEVRRVARVAFEAATGRRARLASVDKANVLASSRLWRRTVAEVSVEFPGVELEHVLVDAAAMHLMREPGRFDVILAPNLFGDILSDEASVLAGSLGMLGSAALGEGTFGVYEPVHGSAPDIAGRGVANPVGALLSAAMLLRHSLRLEEEARALEGAVASAWDQGARTRDVGGELSTRAFANLVLSQLRPAFSPL